MLIFSMAVVSPFVISFFLKDLYHCWSLQPPLFFISLYTLYTALPPRASARGERSCPRRMRMWEARSARRLGLLPGKIAGEDSAFHFGGAASIFAMGRVACWAEEVSGSYQGTLACAEILGRSSPLPERGDRL